MRWARGGSSPSRPTAPKIERAGALRRPADGELPAALPRACAWALGAPDMVDGRLCDCLRGHHGVRPHPSAEAHPVPLAIDGQGPTIPGACAVQELCRVRARAYRAVARLRRHTEAHRSRPRCAIGVHGTGRGRGNVGCVRRYLRVSSLSVSALPMAAAPPTPAPASPTLAALVPASCCSPKGGKGGVKGEAGQG